MSKQDNKNVLESISPERRAFLRKSVKAGFVLPVVGTFTMSGLMATPAAAQANMSF
ncbi:MAG: hypothetical protein HOC23_07770 [Halieaceae bacterium]|nr:hypothetical protein [Halieaceae bacterium]